ncbi:MAG: FAD:protein FMN transferase [Alphaproteobacteria bacterium]|nr:FAD:protein FMN transferase [Alphaproteobacteria bacterium]
MGVNRREFLMGAIGAAGSAALSRFAHAARAHVMGGPAFGTYWRATLPLDADHLRARSAIEDVIAAIDASLSPFRPGSDISRFNAAPPATWMEMGGDAAAVMGEGVRIAALTGGAFDPTVGPIVARYGFGPIRGAEDGGFRGLDVKGSAARKDCPGLTFDPCGIAKGFALDRMAQRLGGLGLGNYVIELGGEICARGAHPAGRPWQVGIERPAPGPIRFQRIVRLGDETMATSGDLANRYDIGGRRYTHIVDPGKTAPVANGVASVSVIAARAMTADALATGLMVMGPERGLKLAERLALGVLFVLRERGRLTEAASTRFGDYLVA